MANKNDEKKVEKTKEQIEAEAKYKKDFEVLSNLDLVPSFSPSLVDVKALDQMIGAHQLKYVENLIQAEEEKKLAQGSIDDLNAYPLEIRMKAVELAPLVKYDPDYFQRNKIDNDLIKPIQLASNIDSKKEEAKIKTWKVEYHGRLINRLRSFRLEAEAREQQINRNKKDNRSFFQRLFNITPVDDHGHSL